MPTTYTNGLFANPNRYPVSWARRQALVYWTLLDPKYLLQQLVVESTAVYKVILQSRHHFLRAARKLLNELSKLSIRAAQWTDYKWDAKYSNGQLELRLFVPRRPVFGHLAEVCSYLYWKIRTGVGRFQSWMRKQGLSPTSICERDVLDETAAEVILEFPLHRAPEDTMMMIPQHHRRQRLERISHNKKRNVIDH